MEPQKNDGLNETLPPVGEHVIVQCRTFSCLGYLDGEGKWKDVYTNEELPEVIQFSPLDQTFPSVPKRSN